MRTTQRLTLALLAAALASAACGARLTSAQQQQALSSGGSGPLAGSTTGGDGGTTGVTVPGTTGVVAPGGSTGTGGTTTGTSGATSTTGAVAPAGTTGGQPVPTDWTKLPPGGNGGATDVGITGDTITVANVSDVSGAVPGLFEDARFAVQAYVKYFNARYPGGIYGRHLKVLPLDSQLDTGAARSASIQACSESFAGVGSISAFDQGAAPIIKDCKSKGGYYPDLRGLATTNQMKAVPNAYPMNAAGTGHTRSFGQYGWVTQMFPQVIKKAVFVYSDGEVTRQNAHEDMEATKNILGFNWVDEIPIGTTETNYAPFAQQIKNDGATYVTFVGAYQQAANLALAMAQFGFAPQVYMPTVTAYTPDFIKQAGTSVQGGNVYIAMPDAINEEVASNPELGVYQQWLQQVKPGARPTSLGQFSWSAAALFVQQMIEVGPHPTRGALLARVAATHGFAPNGMYPAQDVGGRSLSDCVLVIKVSGNAFARVLPSKGYRCIDGLYDLSTKKRTAAFHAS